MSAKSEREEPMSLRKAREQGKLDEFAEQQKGKADVPAPEAKKRFERLLGEMAAPKQRDK